MGLIYSTEYSPESDIVLFEGDTQNLLSQIPDRSIQLIVTSPPYNLGKEYETKIKFETYIAQQKTIIEECVRILKESGSICWQIGNYVNNGEIIPLDIPLYPIFKSLGLHLRNRIIWSFGHGLHASKRFSGRYEVILWFTKTNDYIFNLDEIRIPQKYPNKKHFKGPNKGELSGNPLGKNPSDVWDIPNVKANHIEKTIHPCQFPVELVERLVLSLTNERDTVVDPFIGVGSTAIAAIAHNRKVIGAEIMKEYIEIARSRINQAEAGKLFIRPMERPVYSAGMKTNLPPQQVKIKSDTQPRLLEQKNIYRQEGDKNENSI